MDRKSYRARTRTLDRISHRKTRAKSVAWSTEVTSTRLLCLRTCRPKAQRSGYVLRVSGVNARLWPRPSLQIRAPGLGKQQGGGQLRDDVGRRSAGKLDQRPQVHRTPMSEW